MAPLQVKDDRVDQLDWVGKIRRNVVTSGASDSGVMSAQDPSIPQGGSSIASYTIYLGIGLGVGGAFLVGLIVVTILIVRKRREHKRTIEAMEVEEALQSAQRQYVREMPRPVTALGCGPLVPLNGRAGWGALSSDETVNEPEPVARADRRKRSSVSLPKKCKQRGIPLKKLKRLTAILESPRSRNSPSLPVLDTIPAAAVPESTAASQANSKAYNFRRTDEDDVFVCHGSPKPEVLPSFAIRSPGRYGADIATNNHSRAYRSRSMGAMPLVPNDALFGSSVRMSRGPLHARSISLGAPPTRPPPGPVPPLPVMSSQGTQTPHAARHGVCVSRLSSLSQDSTSSSALVTPPILLIPEQNQSIESPSVEEIVAQDDSASLKAVATNKWQNPLITGPRQVNSAPSKRTFEGAKHHPSIRSHIARYSAESAISHSVSSTSLTSSDSYRNCLSITGVGVLDQVSVSRVSSENSLQSYSGIRKVTTPRKILRTSVSESGSPVERKNTIILRDISGNSIGPSRQPSNATQESSRSSDGNPFHWDQQPLKPSALKGSPNARKGHRRQNCVRISTLTPQILGPPPSRPTSPSIMHGIEEESGDGDEPAAQSGARFVSNQRISRPPSVSYFAPNFRPQPLRASLTPSSPTLSVWAAFQEHGLPSQPSDSQLFASTGTRSASRQSNRSSLQSIPSFPSPVKAAICTTQLSRPVPEFYLSRPSTDIDQDESSSSEAEIPSSPPLSVSKNKEYDPGHPAWPIPTIPAPVKKEYDPASPAWYETEPGRSSAFFPFATCGKNQDIDEGISPRSGTTSYGGDLPDTPPVSPKTMPAGFQAFFDKKDTGIKPARASEKLTSANASTLISKIPRRVDFPGAPVLPPPDEDEPYSHITPKSPRQRAASNAAHLVPMRPAPPPPALPKDSCVPPPLHISGKTGLSGPRNQPPQSVLRNAMALRRMNSEVNAIPGRESRRFMHLGREASPLLPWIGSPDPSESCGAMNELFDFDFASDTIGGAEEHSALDEVNLTEMERKLDGALAGFNEVPREGTVQDDESSSVWRDGEKYWQESPGSTIGFAVSSPVPNQSTPKRQGLDSPRSIQNTPKSLYDSEGFLRT